MRILSFLVVIIALGGGAFLVHRELTIGPPVVLAAPRATGIAAASGASLLPGGWTDTGNVRLAATTRRTNTATGIDVEVRPLDQKFSGTPTDAAAVGQCPAQASCALRAGDPSLTIHLGDGEYHWQVRLHNGRGVSPWVPSRQIIRVDTTPPATPRITSPTDPTPGKTYHSSELSFLWSDSDSGSGVAGYSYRLDTDPHGMPLAELRTSGTAVRLAGLNSGTYYFHLRAQDRAGNWGPPATFPVRIDVTPPGLAHVRFSDFQFDPQYTGLRVSFAVTRAATTVHVGVYRQSTGAQVRLYDLTNLTAGQKAAVTWNGRNAHGQVVRSGAYEIYIRATDRYGHSSLTGWRDFEVDYQRIVVSLSQQRLWAYDGGRLLLTSLVTTGNRALPTPTGTYHIMARFHPYVFRSPWPKSSPFYYPPSNVEYAMLFREGGYFIHDAPWRSVFGPGSNASVGKPGSNYTGTHGCINTPPDVAQRLYAWAQIGTVVVVER